MPRTKQTARKSTGGKNPRRTDPKAMRWSAIARRRKAAEESVITILNTSDEEHDPDGARVSPTPRSETYQSPDPDDLKTDGNDSNVGEKGGLPDSDVNEEDEPGESTQVLQRDLQRTLDQYQSRLKRKANVDDERKNERIKDLEAKCHLLNDEIKQLKDDNERLVRFAKRAHRFINKDDVADLIVHPDRRASRRRQKIEDGTWPPDRHQGRGRSGGSSGSTDLSATELFRCSSGFLGCKCQC